MNGRALGHFTLGQMTSLYQGVEMKRRRKTVPIVQTR